MIVGARNHLLSCSQVRTRSRAIKTFRNGFAQLTGGVKRVLAICLGHFQGSVGPDWGLAELQQGSSQAAIASRMAFDSPVRVPSGGSPVTSS